MGIFSNQIMDTMNGYSAPLNIQEAEGYDDGVYSAQIAQIVGLQNEMALVEAGVKTDMQACLMVNEGVNENEVMNFSESAIGDMFNKIKEFFKKLWAKIKAIFNGFMARLEAKFGKNNKEFINKYKKDIIGKDLTDFEPSHRKKKTLEVISFDNLSVKVQKAGGHISTYDIINNKDISKEDEKFDGEDVKEKLLGSFIGESSVSEKEFEKEAFDKAFEDETTDSVNINDIMTEMMGFKDTRKAIKKQYDNLNKDMNQIIKDLEKASNNNFKNSPVKDNDNDEGSHTAVAYDTDMSEKGKAKVYSTASTSWGAAGTDNKSKNARSENISKHQRALGMLSRTANIVQSAVLKATQVSLKIYDFNNKQNRSIFAKAVAYKRKEESAIMEEAMAELAVWEADY